jgi:hypothetical protein
MAEVQCFWIEPIDRVARSLRRYTKTHEAGAWTCEAGWHEARVPIEPLDEVPSRRTYDIAADERATSGDLWPHDDPRWPAECGRGCGYRFLEDDVWQLFVNRLYRRIDGTPAEVALNEPGAGAMWDAWWYPAGWAGEDGIRLVVQLPDGMPWLVDGPSSSCTEQAAKRPHDTRTGHHCWTRTGDPRAIPPTVSAQPSIASGDPQTYHGFLTDGKLVSV